MSTPHTGSQKTLHDSEHDEIRPLTSLRALAALLVVLHHFSPPTGILLLDSVISQGHIGVTIFFVLSGFLIAARYYESLTTRQTSLYDYFVKRIARIWPLYYVILIVIYSRSRGIPPGGYAVISWTLSQGYFKEFWGSGISTAWSLTVEGTFYLIAPLVFASISWVRRLRWFAARPFVTSLGIVLGVWVAVLASSGLAFRAVSAEWFGAGGAGGFMAFSIPEMAYLTIFLRFLDFAFGIGAAHIWLSGSLTRLWRTSYGTWIATLLGLAGIAGTIASTLGMQVNGGVYGLGWVYNYVAALFSGVVILSLTCPASPLARLMNLSFMVYAGRISYALYLLQFLIQNNITRDLLQPASLFYLPALVLIMIAVSALAYEFIERPGRVVVLWIAEQFRRSLAAPARNST